MVGSQFRHFKHLNPCSLESSNQRPLSYKKERNSYMNNIRVRLIIEGRVQGVWFRDSTRKRARELGVFGWVKNRYDGNVEVLAEGPQESVNSLIAWCGPEISSALRCCLIGSSRVMPSSCRCYLNGYLWRKRQRVLWSSDSENNGGRTSLDPLIRSLRRQICNRALGETILTPCRHGAYTARDRR